MGNLNAISISNSNTTAQATIPIERSRIIGEHHHRAVAYIWSTGAFAASIGDGAGIAGADQSLAESILIWNLNYSYRSVGARSNLTRT
jgi:hypothetical protein